ncbi:MAG: pyruvate kinase, partial [Acidobacteriota bacterium]
MPPEPQVSGYTRATMDRRAKIVATLGPASSSEEVLARLLETGVDVVRLNMSHGDHAGHRKVIENLRRLAREQHRFVPIIIDLMGPRYRLGEVDSGPRQLDAGEEVFLGTRSHPGDLPIGEPELLDHLQVGERMLIDNGMVELEILACHPDGVTTRVVHGGPVATRKGINLPDTDLPFTISEKDHDDIAFALDEGADYLAVSFVGGPKDLEAIRNVLRAHGGMLPLVAKLERAAVLRHLDATVEASDAVMVARGDLGVELPVHDVPILQKKIIAAGRRVGKPVIVATQMLESMMTQPRPTRAEASDCANAIFDGADALMLSGETAAGVDPVKVVGTMSKIIVEAEAYRPPSMEDFSGRQPEPLRPGASEQMNFNPELDRHLEVPDVVSAAAVYATHRLDVRQIVAFSQGGFTARMIARYRPRTPITVFTRQHNVARRLQLVWGARPLLLEDELEHHEQVVRLVERRLLAAELAKPGDVIIILMGVPISNRPFTNLMRVHRVR